MNNIHQLRSETYRISHVVRVGHTGHRMLEKLHAAIEMTCLSTREGMR